MSGEANEQEVNLAAQYFHPESLIEVFFVAMQRQKDVKRSLIWFQNLKFWVQKK